MYTNLKVSFIDKCKTSSSAFFCKICKYPLITQSDFLRNQEYECCSECYLSLIESRKQEWKKAFKIDKTKLSEYLNMRKQQNEKIINITGE